MFSDDWINEKYRFFALASETRSVLLTQTVWRSASAACRKSCCSNAQKFFSETFGGLNLTWGNIPRRKTKTESQSVSQTVTNEAAANILR